MLLQKNAANSPRARLSSQRDIKKTTPPMRTDGHSQASDNPPHDFTVFMYSFKSTVRILRKSGEKICCTPTVSTPQRQSRVNRAQPGSVFFFAGLLAKITLTPLVRTEVDGATIFSSAPPMTVPRRTAQTENPTENPQAPIAGAETKKPRHR